MNKNFEETFSEIQTDMISICLEYIEGQGDKIYIYLFAEEIPEWHHADYASGFFYKINGHLTRRHKVHEELPQINDLPEQQSLVLNILMSDLKEISNLCHTFKKPMPTEMKIIYDIKKNSVSAKYRYDTIIFPEEEITPGEKEMQWFEELQKENE